MNPEKLRKMQEQVRTGGKGSVRRKRKAAVKTSVCKYIDFILMIFNLLVSKSRAHQCTQAKRKKKKKMTAQKNLFFFFFRLFDFTTH
jgi:hypothetical protein